MLVVQRKENQYITVGDDVVIHFFQIKDGSVRVAIDAPNDVAIRRGELLDWVDIATDPSLADTSEQPVTPEQLVRSSPTP